MKSALSKTGHFHSKAKSVGAGARKVITWGLAAHFQVMRGGVFASHFLRFLSRDDHGILRR